MLCQWRDYYFLFGTAFALHKRHSNFPKVFQWFTWYPSRDSLCHEKYINDIASYIPQTFMDLKAQSVNYTVREIDSPENEVVSLFIPSCREPSEALWIFLYWQRSWIPICKEVCLFQCSITFLWHMFGSCFPKGPKGHAANCQAPFDGKILHAQYALTQWKKVFCCTC